MAIQLDLSKMEKNPSQPATFMWLGKQGTRFYEAESGTTEASGYISNKLYASIFLRFRLAAGITSASVQV